MNAEEYLTRHYRLTHGSISLRAMQTLDRDENPISPREYCMYIFESPIPECSGFASDLQELEKVSEENAKRILTSVVTDSTYFLMRRGN